MTPAAKIVVAFVLGIVGLAALAVSLCSGWFLAMAWTTPGSDDGFWPIALIFFVPAAVIACGAIWGLIRIVRKRADRGD